jgi:metal-sulfur cluster biosynthetic enzyme
MSDSDRIAEVLARLSRVSDPELDEPVTELGFITEVEIEAGGVVKIGFRLPTYWCAANFAFMMADDMRREVSALAWVTKVEPRLGDHMYADKINHGVLYSLSFQQSFADTAGDATDGDLDQLRRTFLGKAFQRRQEALLRHLLDVGFGPSALVALHVTELEALTLSESGARLRSRYLERRAFTSGFLAFVTAEGDAIRGGVLSDYLRMLSRVNVSAEFNGALCRGLLAARFGEGEHRLPAQPGLHDFIREAAIAARRVA